MPFGSPPQAWEEITMNFVTDLLRSVASGYAGILVIMGPLTEMTIYILCREVIDSPESAPLFLAHIISKRSVPDNVVTDHGTQLTSPF